MREEHASWAGALRPMLRPVRLALFLIAPLGLVCAAIHLMAGVGIESAVTEGLIYMVIVIGLSIFVGNTGIVSFGHVSFAMIGAYASAWQTCCGPLRVVFLPDLPTWLLNASVPWFPALLMSAAAASVVALATGAALMRLGGTVASIALLSLLFVMKTVYENWNGWTAGQSAIVGLPNYVTLWIAFGFAAGAILVASVYRMSSFGVRAQAIREDELAARASGVNAWLQKLVAFVLSAFVVAVGGVLYGHYLGSITVSMFWLDMTFITLAMLVVGGTRSLTGAIVGTLFVTLVRQCFQTFERGLPFAPTVALPQGSGEIVLGLVLLCVLIFRPQGLVGDREFGEGD